MVNFLLLDDGGLGMANFRLFFGALGFRVGGFEWLTFYCWMM